jgi:hypothetical protein
MGSRPDLGLSPAVQRRAVEALARFVAALRDAALRDDVVPAMERVKAQLAQISPHATGGAVDLAAHRPERQSDPRTRALAARRTRNTGPARNPYHHRGQR